MNLKTISLLVQCLSLTHMIFQFETIATTEIITLTRSEPFSLSVNNPFGDITISGDGKENVIKIHFENNNDYNPLRLEVEERDLLLTLLRISVVNSGPAIPTVDSSQAQEQLQDPHTGNFLLPHILSANLRIVVPSSLFCHYKLVAEQGSASVSNLGQGPSNVLRLGVRQEGNEVTSTSERKNGVTMEDLHKVPSSHCAAQFALKLFESDFIHSLVQD